MEKGTVPKIFYATSACENIPMKTPSANEEKRIKIDEIIRKQVMDGWMHRLQHLRLEAHSSGVGGRVSEAFEMSN